jgi:hypothetical protein
MKYLLTFTIGLICGILMTIFFSTKVIKFWKGKAVEYSNELKFISGKIDILYKQYTTSGYWLYYYPSEFDTSKYYDVLDSLWIDLRQNIKINDK